MKRNAVEARRFSLERAAFHLNEDNEKREKVKKNCRTKLQVAQSYSLLLGCVFKVIGYNFEE